MEIRYDNQKLVDALKDSEAVISSLGEGESLSDEQTRKIEAFKAQPSLIRNVFYLYACHGATKTAELLGCSRRYIYKLIKDIR